MNACVCAVAPLCALLLLLLSLLAVLWFANTTRVWWSVECVDVGGGHVLCVCSQHMCLGGMGGCSVCPEVCRCYWLWSTVCGGVYARLDAAVLDFQKSLVAKQSRHTCVYKARPSTAAVPVAATKGGESDRHKTTQHSLRTLP